MVQPGAPALQRGGVSEQEPASATVPVSAGLQMVDDRSLQCCPQAARLEVERPRRWSSLGWFFVEFRRSDKQDSLRSRGGRKSFFEPLAKQG